MAGRTAETSLDLEAGRELAERLRHHLAAEVFTSGGKSFRVTCSIGLAHFVEAKQKATDLLQAADEALYRAKDNGRNRAEFAAEAELIGSN